MALPILGEAIFKIWNEDIAMVDEMWSDFPEKKKRQKRLSRKVEESTKFNFICYQSSAEAYTNHLMSQKNATHQTAVIWSQEHIPQLSRF